MNSKFDGIPDYEMRSYLEQEELRKELQAEAAKKQEVLEEAFEKCYDANIAEIEKHMKDALDSVNKALAISEESGIPITRGGVYIMNNPYRPYSFKEKWGDLDNQFLMDFDIYDSRPGWQQSTC